MKHTDLYMPVGDTLMDFGYSNGWREIPDVVLRCIAEGHDKQRSVVGRCVTRVECPVCGYFYLVDSSD